MSKRRPAPTEEKGVWVSRAAVVLKTIRGFEQENKREYKEKEKRKYFRRLTSWKDATAAAYKASNVLLYPKASPSYYLSLSHLLESLDPPTMSSTQQLTAAQKPRKYNAEQLAAMNVTRPPC